MADDLVDVIEVQIKAPHTIRVMDTGKSAASADFYIKMAILRRGVEHSFFMTAPTRQFRDGDCLPQSDT